MNLIQQNDNTEIYIETLVEVGLVREAFVELEEFGEGCGSVLDLSRCYEDIGNLPFRLIGKEALVAFYALHDNYTNVAFA